jgi:hypothetical protein
MKKRSEVRREERQIPGYLASRSTAYFNLQLRSKVYQTPTTPPKQPSLFLTAIRRLVPWRHEVLECPLVAFCVSQFDVPMMAQRRFGVRVLEACLFREAGLGEQGAPARQEIPWLWN